MEWRKDDYLITDDNSKVQLDIVHRLLSATYWGDRRPREAVERMIGGSICFSLYRGAMQIGFGRAVTDGATFTWVADIVVEPDFRGFGLGQWLMECLMPIEPLFRLNRIGCWPGLRAPMHNLRCLRSSVVCGRR
ncbi:GNAT family N-acetyltransferase [Marinobacter koreensis]